MRLSIAIPEAQLREAPTVLKLIRQAQASDMEADDQGPVYVAHFEDLLQSVDVVRQLIEECRDPYGIRITVDEQHVTDPVTFYRTLCPDSTAGLGNGAIGGSGLVFPPPCGQGGDASH